MTNTRREGLSTAQMADAMEQRTTTQDTAERDDRRQQGMDQRDNGETARRSTTAARNADTTPLFQKDEAEKFHSRWQTVQTDFVDEPRKAVEHADGLVAEVIQRLAKVFADERGPLEQQWTRGDDVSTEDLRVALQRYRSFFERLLAA